MNSGSDSDIVKYLSSIVISQQLVEAGLRSECEERGVREWEGEMKEGEGEWEGKMREW